MVLRYKFIIEGTLPCLNDYIKQLNANRYKGAELKRTTEKTISLFILQQLKGVKIRDKVFVVFKWVEKNRKRDKDNIASAKKFILDALVNCGVLPDDGWAYVEGFRDEFFVDKNRPRVEVILEKIGM